MDNQWPSHFLPPPSFHCRDDEDLRLVLRAKIETWLSNRWGTRCFVVPSGRAGIGLAFRYLNINRKHVLYAPQWSSHCVWDVLGRFGNPTCANPENADLLLAVHKYGRSTTYTANSRAEIFEDACDALIPEEGSVFPNNGRFSILSLPKIAGMWCGGVLAVRREIDAQGIEALRDKIPFDELAASQGKKRWLAAIGNLDEFDDWSTFEYRNIHPDLTCLHFLQQHLAESLKKNASTIKERLDKLSKIEVISKWTNISASHEWLPPVLPIPVGSIRNCGLMTRQVSLSNDGNHPDFQSCYLIPLHFGVDSEKFGNICASLDADF